MPVAERFDAVVIGGGFYGLRIALHLREVLDVQRVVVIEAEPEAMSRASFANQARVHNGYHYPRSILTGYRSNVNLPRFRAEYGEAVVAGFQHHYAIARTLSRTNARQFELFCHRIGSAVRPASDEVRRRFDPQRIERVFLVEEPAFDSRVLRDLLLSRIERAGGIEVRAGARADRIAQVAGGVEVAVGEASLVAPRVISAVYAGINTLHAASGLPLVDVQQELTEMPLVAVPEPMRDTAVTVMDGPFFSIMPFPSTRSITTRSHFRAMYADVLRYMPAAAGMRHRDSLYEAKTVLARSSDDDSRPILYRRDHGIPGYTCVLGGKLDNIYDVLTELTNDER
jgi:glycine/D-amino acid oxidase-like deaminating enzyme